MLRALAAFAASSCLMACAHSHRPPYTCTVPERTHAWPVIRPSSVAPGRFELKVLDPADPSGRQLDRKIHITADAIPIGTFASRLAEALGTPIAVSHDALPLHAMASTLGWDVQVVDWRPAQAAAQRFPGATTHVLGPEALTALPLEAGCAVVVMSHHLIYDARVLEAVLRSALPAYVGVLGPRKRTNDLLAMLPRDLPLERLHAPVGLALGGEGPAAVALSILSEIHAVLHRAAGGSLSRSTSSG